METVAPFKLPARWTRLDRKRPQEQLWESKARFRVVPPGRRSGKTELAKRFIIVGNPLHGFLGAATYDLPFDDGWFICAAPTHAQAKRIFWRDLRAMVPPSLIRKVHETELSIRLWNGCDLQVIGMDTPDRVEGRPIDGIVLDEYASMKREVWSHNVRPGLSTRGRLGWAWLIGVPEGRNHYWELFEYAKRGDDPTWSAHHWASELIVAPEEIAAAKRELDPLTFEQEFGGSFVNFTGRAYYSFGEHNHFKRLIHFPHQEIFFCFDFNVAPGTAVVCQDQTREQYAQNGITLPSYVNDDFTAVIGEIHIPRGSNTLIVCERLSEIWGNRQRGPVTGHGDATGGAKGTASVRGSDWDLIDEQMQRTFGDLWRNDVARSNPRERVRVNSVNSRCRAADGTVSLLVDPGTCPKLVADLEGVRTKEDGSGEIDKKKDPALTHMSDAIGYFIYEMHPVGGARMVNRQMV